MREDDQWIRGIKIQRNLIDAMEKRFTDLGMIPVNRTECVRYCINQFLQTTARDKNFFGE